MEKLIIRNDDVSPCTGNCKKVYEEIKSVLPDCEIWSCVNVISKGNRDGSVYPFPPFKNRPVDWFYNIDLMEYSRKSDNCDVIASHGLFHLDHSQIHYDAQLMSILSSCRYLETDIFVPPFNRYNEDTVEICRKYNISLIKPSEWRSLETHSFDSNHKKWYFHSWRYREGEICHQLKHGIVTIQP